ncbi:16347_t:CDS:1, partial [Cetraspora pellucida]
VDILKHVILRKDDKNIISYLFDPISADLPEQIADLEFKGKEVFSDFLLKQIETKENNSV